jgi:hypothetical protein
VKGCVGWTEYRFFFWVREKFSSAIREELSLDGWEDSGLQFCNTSVVNCQEMLLVPMHDKRQGGFPEFFKIQPRPDGFESHGFCRITQLQQATPLPDFLGSDQLSLFLQYRMVSAFSMTFYQ